MNKLVLRVMLGVFIGLAPCYAKPSLKDVSVDTVRLEELDEIINATGSQAQARDFAAAVLKSRKMELIRKCFENEYTLHWMIAKLATEPDLEFKDAVTLLLLRSNAPMWPPEVPSSDGSRAMAAPLIEPFASVFRKRLPGIEVTPEMLKYREKRLRLATELEAAMAADKRKAPAPAPDTAVPPRENPAPAPSNASTPTISPQPEPGKDRAVPSIRATGESSQMPNACSWLVGIAAVLAIAGLAVWVFRSRS